MKTTINLHDFRDAFRRAERENFSDDGLFILFNYLEEFEQDCGSEIELDVIALCCDYAEEYPEDIAKNYGIDIDGLSDEQILEKVENYLDRDGNFVGTTGYRTIVYRQF